MATGSIAKMRPLRRGAAGQRHVSRGRAQRVMSWAGFVRNALCRGGESVHNALCHGGGSVRNACFVSRRGGRVHKAFFGESPLSPRGGRCTMPCVTEGGPVHNALCHRGGTGGGFGTAPCVTEQGRPCPQRLVSPEGPCAQRLVSRRGPVHNALCHRGGPVRNALCHSGGGACACGLVARATNFFPASHGLKSQARPCAQRLVSPQGGGRAQRLVSPQGGACAQRLVSSRGGPCAQRLMSPRGDLCTTRCVAQRLVSPRGGLT